MLDHGWIKIYRKMQKKGYYNDSAFVHLWIHLLLSANWEESEFLWNGKIIKVKRGQFITGRRQLERETHIDQHKIDRILKTLESEQQIEQQKTTKFRLITVKNYEIYQSDEPQNEPQVSHKRATSEPQVSTTKEYNNDKNDNKDKNHNLAATPPKLDDCINLIFKVFYDSGNKGITFGNTTQRAAAEWLISKFGFDETKRLAEYACSLNGEKYAPVITTPYQLKEKLGRLKAHWERSKIKPASKFRISNLNE